MAMLGRIGRRRKDVTDSDETDMIRSGTLNPAAASAARARSEARLDEARRLQPEVHAVTTSLRALNERNHFAEMIERSMRRT